MLDSNGRLAYTSCDFERTSIDKDRARNEIALVDLKSGHVTYGIDSLFAVLQHRFPVLKHLFKSGSFRWLANTFYKFISFNRKVIMPARPVPDQQTCEPSFNVAYRVSYILICCLITSVVIGKYSIMLSPIIPAGSVGREFLICGGQILFQMLMLIGKPRNKVITYLGNIMTISLAGSILLLPVFVIQSFVTEMSALACAAWFMMVVTLMLAEHLRRVRLLDFPTYLSVTWVLYRVIVLILILL